MSDPAPDGPPPPDAPGKKPAKDPAKARFIAITLIRMSGAVLVLLGLLITERRLNLPWVVGAIFCVVGFFDVFVMPRVLARRWKTKG